MSAASGNFHHEVHFQRLSAYVSVAPWIPVQSSSNTSKTLHSYTSIKQNVRKTVSRPGKTIVFSFCFVTVLGCQPTATKLFRYVWNGLSQHVTYAASLLPVFRGHLKKHIFSCCFPWLHLSCCAWEVTFWPSDTLIVLVTYFFTYCLALVSE